MSSQQQPTSIAKRTKSKVSGRTHVNESRSRGLWATAIHFIRSSRLNSQASRLPRLLLFGRHSLFLRELELLKDKWPIIFVEWFSSSEVKLNCTLQSICDL